MPTVEMLELFIVNTILIEEILSLQAALSHLLSPATINISINAPIPTVLSMPRSQAIFLCVTMRSQGLNAPKIPYSAVLIRAFSLSEFKISSQENNLLEDLSR